MHAEYDSGVCLPQPRDLPKSTDAAQNAEACRTLLADGESLDGCWRFGILQTLDDYASVLRRGAPKRGTRPFP